jgi:hypothetical protein
MVPLSCRSNLARQYLEVSRLKADLEDCDVKEDKNIKIPYRRASQRVAPLGFLSLIVGHRKEMFMSVPLPYPERNVSHVISLTA